MEWGKVYPLVHSVLYLNNISIDGILAGDDVGLHHIHHGVLQVHLPLPPSNNPRVSVNLLKLKFKTQK